MSEKYKKDLATSRRDRLRNARKKIQSAGQTVALLAYVNPFIDWLFGVALAVAILKDILDLIDNALIAAGGAGLVLIFIFSTLASLLIGFVIFLTGSSSKTTAAREKVKSLKSKLFNRTTRKILVLLGVTLIEFIPAVDLLPLESLTVLLTFWMTLKERREDALAAAEERREQSAQLQEALATT